AERISAVLFRFRRQAAWRVLRSFPTRRSSDLRPLLAVGRRREDGAGEDGEGQGEGGRGPRTTARAAAGTGPGRASRARTAELSEDRKSTRLNSSHVKISYAVFCLQKKTRCY